MPLDFELLEQPLLCRGGLDRAAELRNDTATLEEHWPNALVVDIDPQGRFCTEQTPDGVRVVLEPAFDCAERPPQHAVFLGRDAHGRHIWARSVDELPAAFRPGELMRVGHKLVEGDAALAAEALALLNWHRENEKDFDAGKRPQVAQAGWAGTSTIHGGLAFPRTDPAVICLVHDSRSNLLLGRNPRWPERRFSIMAGFVEAGESVEQCLYREVREEVGIDVERPRYLGSQPWPFPRSLMLGYHAIGDPSQELCLDSDEITEARWVNVEEVRSCLAGDGDMILPTSVSIARGMIESWVAAVEAERVDEMSWSD